MEENKNFYSLKMDEQGSCSFRLSVESEAEFVKILVASLQCTSSLMQKSENESLKALGESVYKILEIATATNEDEQNKNN